VIPTSVGVASFVAGGGLGYFLAHRKLKKRDEEQESELVQLRFEFDDRMAQFNHMIQQAAFMIKKFDERAANFLDENTSTIFDQGKENHPSNGPKEVVLTTVPNDEEDEQMVNVFRTDEEDGWDYAVEVAQRTPDKPYIIHRDEYFSDEMDCSHSTLMYYAGDNILCDEDDTPIYNPDKIVGQLIFGHGSKDPSICYIRNEGLDAEYEVLLDHGYYQAEVLGQEVESGLKHSRGVPKFRMD
jgi:hypothetical protein